MSNGIKGTIRTSDAIVPVRLYARPSGLDMNGTSGFWSRSRSEKNFGAGPGTTLPIRDVHGGAAAAAPHPRWRKRQFIFHNRRGAVRHRQLSKKENLKNS